MLPTAAQTGSQPAVTVKLGGAIEWRTKPRASARPSAAPGTMPAADAASETIAASHAIIRRIWPGVAATARKSAISCSRCWMISAIVPATTKIAMNMPRPPNDAATAINCVRPSCTEIDSALARPAPVSTAAPPAGASRLDGSKPGPARIPIASTRPGCPATLAASVSVRKITGAPLETRLARAMPTTVTPRVGAVDVNDRWAPRRDGKVVTTSSGCAGGRPATRRNGPSGALPQPWACVMRRPRSAGTAESPIAARTPGTRASRPASDALMRTGSPSVTSWSGPTSWWPATTAVAAAYRVTGGLLRSADSRSIPPAITSAADPARARNAPANVPRRLRAVRIARRSTMFSPRDGRAARRPRPRWDVR